MRASSRPNFPGRISVAAAGLMEVRGRLEPATAENDHMLRINRTMGFRAVDRWTQRQQTV